MGLEIARIRRETEEHAELRPTCGDVVTLRRSVDRGAGA